MTAVAAPDLPAPERSRPPAVADPQASPPVVHRRWRPVPTGRLVLASVAAALVALALPLPAPWGLLAPLIAVAVAALVDVVLTPAPRRVDVERRLPAVVPLRTAATVSWTVRSTARRPVTVQLADELAPSLGAATRRLGLVARPGHTHHLDVAIRPARRGRFLPTELVVRTTGPLGLMARQATRLVAQELKVYPPFGPRQHAEVMARIRVAGVGDRRDRVIGGGTDFDQLREYNVDDDARRIDWAATARVSRPIVRTYRVERNQTLLVAFDNGRMMAGRVAGVPRAEHAMDAVLMLTAAASRLGDRLGLLTFDDEVRTSVAPRIGTGQLARVSEALYELEPALVESDYQAAFAQLVRNRRRALVCVLCELADESLTETLLPALPLLVRTHLVLVGAVRDPDVDRWAREAPTTAEEAYRQAAALRHLDGRRRLAARLGAYGAVVVDRVPGDLAPALTDAYLRAKFTGAL